jgi:3-hydroxyacyl-[acyl-carrier-protein] dehydratase
MSEYRLSLEQIKKFIPHRDPFLLIDRVLEISPTGKLGDMSVENDKTGTKVIAIKNISAGEPVFRGHFPEYAIFPGVLIVEAMAQASCFTLYPYFTDSSMAKDFQCILAGVEGARFRRPVIPGDVLRLEVTLSKQRGKLYFFDGVALVDGVKVAEAQIIANLMLKGE